MNIFFINKNISFNNKTLDKYQTKAVLCNKRAYLVVAGAGSGKTLTIEAKVDYLLKNNYKSSEILCISFTNETVNSLKSRLLKNNILVDVKTFHKLALDIIGNKYNISSSNLLKYVTLEYLSCLIYQDSTYKLLEFIDNVDCLKTIIISFINTLKSLNLDYTYIFSLLNNKIISTDDKIILSIIIKVYLIKKQESKRDKKFHYNTMFRSITKKKDLSNRWRCQEISY